MIKLEAVFGRIYLPENARAEFQQAAQSQTETLKDWACRVLSLVTDAYPDQSDSFTMSEAISSVESLEAEKSV